MESHPANPLVESFIESLVTEKGYSDHTCRAYRKDLNDFFDFAADYLRPRKPSHKRPLSVALEQIDGIMIRGYLGLLHRKNKKTTVARKLSAIRSFFKFLEKRGLISENPAEHIMTPKQDKTIPVYLSVDEMFRLLDSIQTDTVLDLRNRAIFETLYSSGIRVSELTQMNLSDVDFEAAVIRVLGKGNQQRIIPVGHKALTAIKAYRTRLQKKANIYKGKITRVEPSLEAAFVDFENMLYHKCYYIYYKMILKKYIYMIILLKPKSTPSPEPIGSWHFPTFVISVFVLSTSSLCTA